MRKKRILITGSSGFVGRHFDARLELENYVDRIDKDLGTTAQSFFNHASDTLRYDLVIHLAAMVGGRAKIDGDPLAIAENLAIDSDMFRWAIRTRQPRIVYFSSSAAYPVELQSTDWITLKEDDISWDYLSLPDQTYGWGKLTGELLAQQAEAEGVRVHVFRPFSGYGEDQSTDYPFAKFIERAIRRDDPFDIWGDGTQTRDFIHIDDIVSATFEAVELDIAGPVNLGWGRATSFNTLAQLITQEAGYAPEFNHILSAPKGVQHRVADTHKLNSFYVPRITLEEGIQIALRSHNG